MASNQLFLTFFGISLGAFLGALGSKLVAVDYKTHWKWAYYLIGIASIAYALYMLFQNQNQGSEKLPLAFPVVTICTGILIIVFTYFVLDIKNLYKPTELNSIINKFTSTADKTEIRLFGGDLNFFGNTPNEMDNNIQYNALKSFGFQRILILCEEPRNSITRIRYGKILSDLRCAEFRFYNPEEADLKVRGRMKVMNGVEKLLIYKKHEDEKRYQAINTDTANSSGALYNNIWKLIWSMATKLPPSVKRDFVKLYRG